jgi:hypothetical protein
MLLPGAEALGMTHSQCLELLEGVEETIDFFVSGLTYLVHAESQKAHGRICNLGKAGIKPPQTMA